MCILYAQYMYILLYRENTVYYIFIHNIHKHLYTMPMYVYTGKPGGWWKALIHCQTTPATAVVDRLDYYSDQLSILCAEVAVLQNQAISALEIENNEQKQQQGQEVELKSILTQSPLHQNPEKYPGSFSTTTTLGSGLGINASSPLHISNKPTTCGNNPTSSSNKPTTTLTTTNPNATTASTTSSILDKLTPQQLLEYSKTTGTTSVQLITGSVKTVSDIGQQVQTFIGDVSEKLTSNLASATGKVHIIMLQTYQLSDILKYFSSY